MSLGKKVLGKKITGKNVNRKKCLIIILRGSYNGRRCPIFKTLQVQRFAVS